MKKKLIHSVLVLWLSVLVFSDVRAQSQCKYHKASVNCADMVKHDELVHKIRSYNIQLSKLRSYVPADYQQIQRMEHLLAGAVASLEAERKALDRKYIESGQKAATTNKSPASHSRSKQSSPRGSSPSPIFSALSASSNNPNASYEGALATDTIINFQETETDWKKFWLALAVILVASFVLWKKSRDRF